MLRSIICRTALAACILATTLLGVRPPSGQASRQGLDTNITLSVYTCCGSLQGFNDTNPLDLYSIHNIYAKLWAKAFPGLKFKETEVNDQPTLETKLTLAVSSGDPPDLVFIQGGYIGYTVLRKLAQPLDKYYAQYKVSDSLFLPAMAKWAHFGGHWWAIPAVSGPQAGQVLFIPKYTTPLGYDVSNLRTFDDLYQLSKKAVQFDHDGNLTRIGYWPYTGTSWGSLNTGMCPLGHGLYNAANQPTATDPCNVALLTLLKNLTNLYGGYAKLKKFISGDPSFWNGSPKDYMATGKAIVTSDDQAYWVASAFDAFNFGVKGGISYQLTKDPITANGSMDEAANIPTTQQEIIIPPGAQHPDVAFALSKFICWDNGYLLGPSTNGSPIAADQEKWLSYFYKGEAAARKSAGMTGNIAPTLAGMNLQPTLARNGRETDPTNPDWVYYLEQLNSATDRVLYGQQSPADALAQVQRLVTADDQRLKSQYGAWNW